MAQEDWPEPTKEELNKNISDDSIFNLSQNLAGYSIFKHMMGLSAADIENIDKESFDDLKLKFYAALMKWSTENLYCEDPEKRPTFGNLIKIAERKRDGIAAQIIRKECDNIGGELSTIIPDDSLFNLSQNLADYDTFKYMLGLSAADIDSIDRGPGNTDGIKLRFRAVLTKWKAKYHNSKDPQKIPTFGNLVKIATRKKDGVAVRTINRECVEQSKFQLKLLKLWTITHLYECDYYLSSLRTYR